MVASTADSMSNFPSEEMTPMPHFQALDVEDSWSSHGAGRGVSFLSTWIGNFRKELAMSKKILATTAVVLALAHSSASAKNVLDLGVGVTATINSTAKIGGGFVVSTTDQQPTGTGVIKPFLTVQQKGNERGFNTDVTGVLDTKRLGTPGPGGWTRTIKLGDIGSTSIGGINYLQFLLDINQVANGNISLDQIQFFTSSVDLGTVSNTLTEANGGSGGPGNGGNDALISFGASATEVFRLNNLENNDPTNTLKGSLAQNTELWIDSGRGSGSGDIYLYVQSSLFGTDPNKYVTLFSQFGNPTGTYTSSAGFEEWAYKSAPTTEPPTPVGVPVPASVQLFLAGVIPLGLLKLGRSRCRSASAVA